MKFKVSDINDDDPEIWVSVFGRKIKTAADAFEFLYEHPNAYDHDDQNEWDKLTLKDRWSESHGQFIEHMTLSVSKKGVWLETGPIYWEDQFPDMYKPRWHTNMHDIRLDVGAKTFEKALIKLAKKVRKYYGDY